jgi:O-antigen/teichoic acid export membrane protein
MSPSTNLGSRFLLNIAAFGYGPVVTLIVQLVQVPLFLSFWGVQKYGEWLVLTGVPLTFVLADAGVAQASASKCIMEVGRQNFEEARNTLRTARAYATLVALSLAFVALVLAGCVDWSALLKLNAISSGSASIVFLLVACYVAVTLQGGYLGAWLRGSDRTPVHAFFEGSTRLLDLCVVAVALWLGGSFVAVGAALLLSGLFCRVTQAFVARRLSSDELSLPGKATWNQLRVVLKPSAAFIGITLTQTLTVQGGIQVLNQISNQQTVVLFNAVRVLVRTLVLFGAAVSNALRPELARLVGQEQGALAVAFSRGITIGTLVFGTAMYMGFVALGPLVIEWWTHSEVTASHVVVGMVGLHALLHVAWLMPATLSIATNRHTGYAAVYLGSAILAIGIWIAGQDFIEPIAGAALLLATPECAALLLALVTALKRRRSSAPLASRSS